jgi:hypothetical protein
MLMFFRPGMDLDGAKPDVWDQWKLVHFFALVMHAAERKVEEIDERVCDVG